MIAYCVCTHETAARILPQQEDASNENQRRYKLDSCAKFMCMHEEKIEEGVDVRFRTQGQTSAVGDSRAEIGIFNPDKNDFNNHLHAGSWLS